MIIETIRVGSIQVVYKCIRVGVCAFAIYACLCDNIFPVRYRSMIEDKTSIQRG